MNRSKLFSRRGFLGAAAAAIPVLAQTKGIRIGVTDWNLRKGANPESVALAASLGFDGVEVSFGRSTSGYRLPVDNAETLARYREEFRKHKIAIAGTCVDQLHVHCLMNEKLGQKWVLDGIRMSRELDARVLLLPFFGKCALQTQEEMDGAAAALKEIVKEAEKAGVTLGLENTISAENNVGIMEKVGSPALKVYYDAGNSINAGHDPYKELRWLGASRICQIHIKDNPNYLGEGRLRWDELIQIIVEIGFTGFANLETSSPSKSVEADMRRNLSYVRGQMNRFTRG